VYSTSLSQRLGVDLDFFKSLDKNSAYRYSAQSARGAEEDDADEEQHVRLPVRA